MTRGKNAVRQSSRRLGAGAQILLLVLLVPLFSCSAHTAFQLGDFRDRILDAYGGRERLSQIQSIAAEGSIRALVRGDSGVYRRAWRRDGKLFVDIQYSRSRETRVLNGTRTLRSVDGKMDDVSGASALAMIYQYNELSMPFALLDASARLEDRGTESREGVNVRTVRYTDRAGNSMDLFVNEMTYRIVKTAGTFEVGGASTTLSSEYANFRFIEGILLPLRIVNYSQATRISEIVINDYLLNAPLSETMFDPHAKTPQH